MIERRHAINARYREALGGIGGVNFMPWDDRGVPNGWLTVITLGDYLLDSGVTPMSVCEALAAEEIEARLAWKPMHQQPVFAGVPVVGGAVADEVFARGVCLPSGSGLTDHDVERVVAALSAALGRHRG